MDNSRPADELDGLRRFLDRLESKELAIRRGPLDVSQKEIDILKREIAHLERILARYKSGDQNA
jgi:polyhydroxyalkanoate synthesis regulator phasin